MKIPKFTNEILNNQNFEDNENNEDKEKTPKKKNILPFLNLTLEKNKKFSSISNNVSKANTLINSQTEKLLLKGFEGSEEDFKKCYHKKNSPIKIKKMISVKKRKTNNIFRKDRYKGIRLTITKEFHLSNSKNDKILEQIKLNKLTKSNSQIFNLEKRNNLLLYNLLSDNNEGKAKQLNSSNSLHEQNKSNTSKKINKKKIFNEKNSLKINTFNFFNKNSENRNDKSKKLLNRPQSFKAFTTLRYILNDTSNNINSINNNLKQYILKNKQIFEGFNSTKNKTVSNNFFNDEVKEDEKKLNQIFGFSKRKNSQKELKSIKNDNGLNSENIWMKKSTANLILFGKILHINDNRFYKEQKRILEDYPKLEEDAELNTNEILQKKYDSKNIIRLQKIRFDRSNKKIKNINKMTDTIIDKIRKKIKNLKKQV